MALKVRALTADEVNELKRLAGSRTAPHRLVQRAQIIWASAQGGRRPDRQPSRSLAPARVNV